MGAIKSVGLRGSARRLGVRQSPAALNRVRRGFLHCLGLSVGSAGAGKRRELWPPCSELGDTFMARPAAQAASCGRLGSFHLRTVWRCGPDARLGKRANRLSHANLRQFWRTVGPASQRLFAPHSAAKLPRPAHNLPHLGLQTREAGACWAETGRSQAKS